MEKEFQNARNLELELQQPTGIYLLKIIDGHNQKTTARIVKV